MNDFSTFKFRCSGLGNLLIDPRSKTDPLSETTKTYLREIWIAETYKREKYIATKYMDKGIACESDSLDLVCKVAGKTYFKNLKRLENEFIAGTPDVIGVDYIRDIKTSWDIWTYAAVTEDCAKKTYFGQLMGYMWLTSKKQSKLDYCLVNTPEEIISYELYKLKASMAIKDTAEDEEKARANYIFDDIEPVKRMKTYAFDFDEETQKKLIERIQLSRVYMNGLSL